MFRTFNMGVGLIVACRMEHVDRVLAMLRDAGEPEACVIGGVVAGERAVRYAPPL